MNEASEFEFEEEPLQEQRSAGDAVPIGLTRLSPSVVQIEWSDGKVLVYRASRLRTKCPCATCRERRRSELEDGEVPSDDLDLSKKVNVKAGMGLGLPILSAAEAKPDTIESLKPIGNYAYNIVFGDGHRTGLFTLDFLYEIGEPLA